VPNPPPGLSYRDFEEFRYRELLKRNGVSLTPGALMSTVEAGSAILQAAAAHMLGAMGDKQAIPALERLLSNPDDLARVEAAYALARLGDSRGRKELIECLKQPVNAFISPPMAAGYLARLGDSQGFGVVKECFAVDNLVVRMLACKVLFFFVPFQGKPATDGTLIDVMDLYQRALRDPEPDVRGQAQVQLRELDLPAARALSDLGG
jgi:HEAT repeat protein